MTDLIKAAKLWARTSAKTGGTYYVGRMGGCRVLVLENRDRQGEDEPTHWLMLGDAEAGQERDPARRPQQQSKLEARQDGPAKPSARPVGRSDGWRGSAVPPARERRPAGSGGRRRGLLRGQSRGHRSMIRDDAALDEILDALGTAEALARRAAHALAEAEEQAEEDAASRAEVDACRARLEAAETLVDELQRRRRKLESELDWREVLRAHAKRVSG